MNNQRGLSLIELMISITLGLVLMTGVIQMFLSSKTVFMTQQGSSRVQEAGRLAIEFISRDLRMASYFGCVRTISATDADSYNVEDPLTIDPTSGLAGLHQNFVEGVRGYNTTSTVAADKLPHSQSVDLGVPSTVTPRTDSDILVIRGANERGIPLKTAATDFQVKGYTPIDPTVLVNNCIEGFCKDGIAVVSDCGKGRIFKISVDPGVATKEITLTHADDWKVADNIQRQFSTGSIFPVHTIVYFVATDTLTKTPSLWQRVDNNDPILLLQGVEDMFITYSGDGVKYDRAKDVTDWDAIYSLKIELLTRGLEEARYEEEPQPIIFGLNDDGSPRTLPFDKPEDKKYLRKVFKSTMAVRTRVPDQTL